METNKECDFAFANSLIGGKWKLRILWHIIQGENRFSVLKKVIPNITEKVLYSNLKELVEAGLIYKVVVKKEKPSIITYHIVKEHQQLEKIILSLSDFVCMYRKLND